MFSRFTLHFSFWVIFIRLRHIQAFLLFLEKCGTFCSDVTISFTFMTLDSLGLIVLLISSCLLHITLLVIDDISSLCNFICNFITFWSSQGNLSSKKSRKAEENTKSENVSRFGKNVTRFHKVRDMLSTLWKTCHDGKNVTRFQETLIQLFVI